jgi:hypothetical protein
LDEFVEVLMRRIGTNAIVCLSVAATSAGQDKPDAKVHVMVTGCLQAEPQPASAHGLPVFVVANASVSRDRVPTASEDPRPILEEPEAGTAFVLVDAKHDLSKYIGKRVEVRASIAQAAQNVPKAIGTSGSKSTSEVKSEGWPRARVKEVHSIGECAK